MCRRHYPIETNCVLLVVVAATSIDLSPLPISNDIERVINNRNTYIFKQFLYQLVLQSIGTYSTRLSDLDK